ncbi:hypothetical protein PACTADRAFT_17162 [Pachysolen tannophilus NRRL Y-2460]|uniref:Autophagy-related protein 27 n=1 Tax=Pachysolen tannophilus NRRL Y-2460 TaxID=669874 RepID=A0A1E4TV70_PACTA|nr:hypothetical protein PACTADRAFT_17162 [Pachysolen tannophilus NRRL Y-2460]
MKLTFAIDVAHDALSDYKIGQLIGIYELSSIRDTPPSVTNLTWVLNIYDSKADKSSSKLKVENCPENAQLCGLTTVSLPGKDAILTEIISFPNNLKFNTRVEENIDYFQRGMNDSDFLEIEIEGANWGKNSINAHLKFICDKSSNNKLGLNINGLTFQGWNGYDLYTEWVTTAACAGTEGSNPSKPPPKQNHGENGNDDSSHWGWFTWLFIFMVLLFAAYVIGNAWINANSSSGNEFLNELIDSFIDILHRIPSFLQEIWNKIFGSSSERGGYSAV